MVDAPPIKTIMVPVLFLFIYSFLIASMPIELVSGETYSEYEGLYPESYWDMSSILNQTSLTYNHNITGAPAPYRDDWGKPEFGHNFAFYATNELIKNDHYFTWIGLPINNHAMYWTALLNGTGYGQFLYYTEIEEVAQTSDEGITFAQFRVHCDHVSMFAVVGYNQSLSDNFQDAWSDDNLSIEWRIGWDEVGTSMSAWDLLTGLIFFQPESLDIHPSINVLLVFPIWASLAYIAFVLVLAWLSGTVPFIG